MKVVNAEAVKILGKRMADNQNSKCIGPGVGTYSP